MSSLRALSLALDPKDFLLRIFSKGFIVLHFTLKSVVHFGLISA